MGINKEENLEYLADALEKIVNSENIGEKSFQKRLESTINVLRDKNIPYERKTPSIEFALEIKSRYETIQLYKHIKYLISFFENALITKDLEEHGLKEKIEDILCTLKSNKSLKEKKNTIIIAENLKPQIELLNNKNKSKM